MSYHIKQGDLGSQMWELIFRTRRRKATSNSAMSPSSSGTGLGPRVRFAITVLLLAGLRAPLANPAEPQPPVSIVDRQSWQDVSFELPPDEDFLSCSFDLAMDAYGNPWVALVDARGDLKCFHRDRSGNWQSRQIAGGLSWSLGPLGTPGLLVEHYVLVTITHKGEVQILELTTTSDHSTAEKRTRITRYRLDSSQKETEVLVNEVGAAPYLITSRPEAIISDDGAWYVTMQTMGPWEHPKQVVVGKCNGGWVDRTLGPGVRAALSKRPGGSIAIVLSDFHQVKAGTLTSDLEFHNTEVVFQKRALPLGFVDKGKVIWTYHKVWDEKREEGVEEGIRLHFLEDGGWREYRLNTKLRAGRDLGFTMAFFVTDFSNRSWAGFRYGRYAKPFSMPMGLVYLAGREDKIVSQTLVEQEIEGWEQMVVRRDREGDYHVLLHNNRLRTLKYFELRPSFAESVPGT